MNKKSLSLILAVTMLSASGAWAAGKGGWSMGFNLGIVNADQKDMNSIIEHTDSVENNNVSKLGNAWEGSVQLAYRFSDISLIFRPSYIYNVTDGKDGSGGKYEYASNGYTFFPILRFHLLENSTMKFFANLGVGFAWVNGKVKEKDRVIEYSGNDFGYMGGLGAEFCFWGNHCLNVEGNVRFLNVDRTTVQHSSGSYDNTMITSDTEGSEFEILHRDFAVNLTGVQAFLGYVYYF